MATPTRSLRVQITGNTAGLDSALDKTKKGLKLFGLAAAAAGGAAAVGLKMSADAAIEAQKSQARLEAQLKASGISYKRHQDEIDKVIAKHSKLAAMDDEDLSDAFTNIVRVTGDLNKSLDLLGVTTDIARAKQMDVAKAAELVGKVAGGNLGILSRYGIQIEKGATASEALAILQEKFAGQAEKYGKTAAASQERFSIAVENLQEKIGEKLLPVITKVTNSVANFVTEMEDGTGAGGRFAAQVTAAFESVVRAGAAVRDTIAGLVNGFQTGEAGARNFATGLSAVVAGFVAMRVVTSVVAGVTALKAAWAGLGATLVANPIGLVAAAIGAVAGALLVMRVRTRSAADASRDLNEALRSQADALRAVRDIDIDVAQRKANLASANIAVEQAEKRLRDLRRDGKASALDIRQAEADLQQARVSQRRATRDVGDAEADARRKRQDANKATDEAAQKTRDLINVKKFELKATEDQIGALGRQAARFGTTSEKTDELRGKAARLRAEIGRLEDRDVKVQVQFMVPGIGNIASKSGDGIGAAVRGAVGKLAQRSVGAGSLPRFGGGLKGARPSMGPVAAIGQRFGLGISSGLRPGSITSSGNRSYHSTGEALDLAGSAPAMLGFFRFMKSTMGPRLAELIYTPGGAGIHHGRPHRFSGAVAADHFDHVHVAIDSGAPGVGDGIGKFASTAYGPPWNAMNGTGVTATGVDLRPAKKAYGIAVDPRRLKLGKNYYVWPNPFGHRGPFKAFDTGGAIKGNRIDFYDWRGRAKQLGWGRRAVTISDDPALNQSGGSGTAKGTGKSAGPGSVTVKPSAGGPNVIDSGPYQTSSTVDPEVAAARAFADRRAGGPSPNRPLKGGGPTKGFSSLEEAEAAQGPAPPTAEDWLTAAIARAGLTEDLADDVAAWAALRDHRKVALDAALADSDPRNDAAAISAWKEAVDAITTLTNSIDEANRIQEQRDARDKEIAENQKKILALANHGPQVVAAVVAAVSGGIGGRVGLGFQTPGYAGGVARY